jgi:putative flippase GtrA
MIVRWMRFNAVGLAGVVVQLAALALYQRLGMHYLLATALAVETAILHNWFWHRRWTWRGRDASLLRFHMANGAVSICSNVVLMRVLAGWLAWPLLIANLTAIAATSLVNFFLGERWVFISRPAALLPASPSTIRAAGSKPSA